MSYSALLTSGMDNAINIPLHPVADGKTAVLNRKNSNLNSTGATTGNRITFIIPAASVGEFAGSYSVFVDGVEVQEGTLDVIKLPTAPGGGGDTDLTNYYTKIQVDNQLNTTAASLNAAIASKANNTDLKTVAKSGSYLDLFNKPTIPAALADLTDGSAFVASIAGKANNSDLKAVAKSGLYSDLLSKPTIPAALSDLSDYGVITTIQNAITALQNAAPVSIASYLTPAIMAGTADATPAFQQAFNDLGGKALMVPVGTYRFDGSIVANPANPLNPINIEWANGCKIIQNSNNPVINLSAPSLGTSANITADVAAGQKVVQATTGTLTVGQWVYLQDNSTWPGPKAALNGEIHRIQQIDGSGQFRTRENIDVAFTTAQSARIRQCPMIEGVRIVGGTWINNLGATVTNPMIRLTRCAKFLIRNVEMRGAGGPGITISGGSEGVIDSPRFYDFINDEANGNFGYGIEWFGATRAVIVNNPTMSGGRHMVTTNSSASTSGVPRHCFVFGGYATGMNETCYDTHEEGDYIHFINPVAIGNSAGGMKHRSPNSTIINPIAINNDGTAVRWLPTAVNGTLSGGLISNNRGIGVQIQANNTTIKDVKIDTTTSRGIFIDDGASNSVIDTPNIKSPGSSAAIEYTGTSANHRLTGGIIDTAPTGVLVASTVTNVKVYPMMMNAVTTPFSGPMNRINQTNRRGFHLPLNTLARTTVNATSGRGYVSRFEIVDTETWSQVVGKFIVTAAATDPAGTAVHGLYDLGGNLLVSSSPVTGLDSTGIKTLGNLNYSPLLGATYLHVVLFVFTSGTLTVEAMNFNNAESARLLGTASGQYDAGYTAISGGILPASLPAVTTGAVSQFPHLWVSPS